MASAPIQKRLANKRIAEASYSFLRILRKIKLVLIRATAKYLVPLDIVLAVN